MSEITKQLQAEINEHGSLPEVTGIGGYPLIYFTDNGRIICGTCATKEGDAITGRGAYFEGSTLQCDECNTDIESAYGDPEDEDEEPAYEGLLGTDINCLHCGTEQGVHIMNMFANTCYNCGGEHNGFGQKLAPRSEWGQETGEEGEF